MDVLLDDQPWMDHAAFSHYPAFDLERMLAHTVNLDHLFADSILEVNSAMMVLLDPRVHEVHFHEAGPEAIALVSPQLARTDHHLSLLIH